jgi:hypothetical protein
MMWLSWHLLVVGIVVIITIILLWKHSEQERRWRVLRILIPLLLIGTIWWYWRTRGHVISWNTADFWLFLAFVSFVTGRLFVYEERYLTFGHVIADNFHGCYYTPPVEKGFFTIFNCDSFCHIIPWEKGKRTLIVPTPLVRYLDLNKTKAAVSCFVEKLNDIRKVPLYIYNYIVTDPNLNDQNVYFGMFDRKVLFDKTPIILEDGRKLTYADYYEEFKNMNSQINRYQEFADGRSKDIEDMAAHLSRVGKKITGGKLHRIYGTEKRKEEEEEY